MIPMAGFSSSSWPLLTLDPDDGAKGLAPYMAHANRRGPWFQFLEIIEAESLLCVILPSQLAGLSNRSMSS
jgi:hypothetical protein